MIRKIGHHVLLSAIFLLAFTTMAAAAGDVSVSGRIILRDGRPWVARGVTLVGLVAPAGAEIGPGYASARQHFSEAELQAVRRFGADLIRFQVSQPGLDPQMPIYSPAYLTEVERAVAMARRLGFTVILSMQAEKPSGMERLPGMPTDSTQRAWQAIVPRFANDRGVMLELFNEPAIRRITRWSWNRWTATMQGTIDAVRAAGARNVLLVDGLYGGKVLEGAPPLHDPLNQLVYAVHPYQVPGNTSPQEWEASFGRFADAHPVMVTEWNMTSARNCYDNSPQIAQQLLSYLRSKNIGVVGWAFDLPGTLVKGFNWNATDFDGFRCGRAGNGAGRLLQEHFLR